MQEKFPEPIRHLFRNAQGNADADRLEHLAPETISSKSIGFLTYMTKGPEKCSVCFLTKLPCRFTADRAAWESRFVKSTSSVFRIRCTSMVSSYSTSNWCALHPVLLKYWNTSAP